MRLPSSLAAIPVAALLIAGCGGTDSGGSAAGDADPASLMPSGSVVYVEGVVQPEGDQEEQLRTLLSKVLRTDDPGAKVKGLIDQGLKDEGDGQTFAKDIEPWLGDRVGVSVTNLAADEPGYIVALAAKDADKATSFVESESKDQGAKASTYKDTDFFLEDDGTATGVVEDFVVVAGTEADFKKAVDTADGGKALDGAERFEQAVDDLPDDRLGTMYVDTQSFAEAAAASSGDEAAAGLIKGAIDGVGAITAFAQASDTTATIESRTVISGDGQGAELAKLGSGAAPELLKSLPEGAWAAFGVGKLGESVRTGLGSLGGGVGSAILGQQVQQATGLDLESDVLSWIGDTAVFVEGDSMATIGGGLVIQATDEAAAGRALPKLVAAAAQSGGLTFQDLQMGNADQAWAAQLPGAPGPLVLARSGDRVVFAVGDDTAATALNPSSTLEDSGIYDRAKEALDGVEPTMLVDGPTAVKLIGESAASDPDYAEAKPYLELLDLLAAGSSKDGDTLRQRFTAKVK